MGDAVTNIVGVDRVGPFVMLRDEDGLRHAVRLASVLSASDADRDRDMTVIVLSGGRTVTVHVALDELLRSLA